jgi:Zn-dependent protease with chaperone function
MAQARTSFFRRQSTARRNTALLVVLFTIAVTLITLCVCLVGYWVTRSDTSALPFQHWLLTRHGLITAGATVLLILTGSLARWIDLAGGGERVARMVSARAVDPSTSDRDERRLINVAEEMAIASGVPVPRLYIMDRETGINAFVAGYTPGEAVMVVTHGSLTHLSRDELQGVVAHEFSHILNGDMRLNVRLISLLAGILMIGQVGSFLVRSGFHSGPVRSRSRDRRGQAALGLVGLALLLIGYIGVFFGRLIQAAVSRQRESLADASAVQFTRNPEGIASALFRIGQHSGYLETTSHASDMNHMCFCESAKMKLTALLASHPPIEDRIRTIEPGMLARMRSRSRGRVPPETTPGATSSFSPVPGQILDSLPDTFRQLLYTRTGAVHLCYALMLLHLNEQERATQLARLQDHPSLGVQPEMLRTFFPALESLGETIRFPALELATPALRKLDNEEVAEFRQRIKGLIEADGRVTLFEMALASYLQRHLTPGAARKVPVRYRSYLPVKDHLCVLFSLLARAGSNETGIQRQRFQEAMAGFTDGGEQPGMVTRASGSALQDALHHLNRLSPMLKPGILDACKQCVSADGRIEMREYEMVRLVADQLDWPMPPLALT